MKTGSNTKKKYQIIAVSIGRTMNKLIGGLVLLYFIIALILAFWYFMGNAFFHHYYFFSENSLDYTLSLLKRFIRGQ
jgi:hypothetical protein